MVFLSQYIANPEFYNAISQGNANRMMILQKMDKSVMDEAFCEGLVMDKKPSITPYLVVYQIIVSICDGVMDEMHLMIILI